MKPIYILQYKQPLPHVAQYIIFHTLLISISALLANISHIKVHRIMQKCILQILDQYFKLCFNMLKNSLFCSILANWIEIPTTKMANRTCAILTLGTRNWLISRDQRTTSEPCLVRYYSARNTCSLMWVHCNTHLIHVTTLLNTPDQYDYTLKHTWSIWLHS